MGRRKKRDAKKHRTHVTIVQDKSGSMMSRTQATIDGFNEYKNGLVANGEGEILMTLVQFDTTFDERFVSKPIAEVPDLDFESYRIGGGTALNDAVMKAIKDTEPRVAKDDSVILVIMTDGEENSSVEFAGPAGQEKVKAKLEELRQAGWDVTYLGAGEDSWAAGAAWGFQQHNMLNYGADALSHVNSYVALTNATITKTRSPDAAFAYSANDKALAEATAGTAKKPRVRDNTYISDSDIKSWTH